MSDLMWHNSFSLDSFGAPGVSFVEYEGKWEFRRIGDVKSIQEVVEAYAPLAALIMKMAAMSVNGKFEILNRETQNYTRGKYKAWDSLFLQPNPIQTRTEFFTQLEAFVLMRGYCYVMPVYAIGFSKESSPPVAMWILPPWCIRVEPVKKPPMFASTTKKNRRVWFEYGGYSEELDEKELLLFKDTGSTAVDELTWLPKSRIQNLKYPISNGIGTMESMHSLIHDRGASGILAHNAGDVHGKIPMQPKEQQRLEKEYKKDYGLTRSKKSSVIITSASVTWQPMTFNVKDLMLHEQHASCIKDICAMYGFPPNLLNLQEGATFNNQQEYKRSAYEDCIIPNSQARMEQWNIGLNAINLNIEILQSFDHLPVMQQTELEKGKGKEALNKAWVMLWNNGMCTRNMWLIELGMDTVDDPLFDLYKFQLTPEELGIVVPEENKKDEKNPK